METYQYILLVLTGGIIAAYIYYVFFPTTTDVKTKKKEGFESLMNCKNQGYPHDFCMRVPIQSYIGPPIGNFTEKKFNTFSYV